MIITGAGGKLMEWVNDDRKYTARDSRPTGLHYFELQQ